MKRIFLGCTLLACCLLAFSCTQKPSEPSSNPSSENGSSQPSSYLSSGINSEEQQKKHSFRLARKAPSDVGYEYVWDETLLNIYAPSEAFTLGGPHPPGGEPIHIPPHVEHASGTTNDTIRFGGDVIGYNIAHIQAIERAVWDDEEFVYSNNSFTKEYTKEEMAPYIIREDDDYVLLDITELVLGAPFEEFLLKKEAERNTPEVLYSWVLEPAAHLKEHLSDIIQKQ